MRFCPFCSAENSEGATHCASCSRKLPPVPPRREQASSLPAPAVIAVTEPRLRPASESARHRLPPTPSRAGRDRAAADRRPTSRVVTPVGAPGGEIDTEPMPIPPRIPEPTPPPIPPPVAPRRSVHLDDWDEPDTPEPEPEPQVDDSQGRPLTGDDYTMPPTQIGGDESPSVAPVPEVPEGGVIAAVKYLVQFVRASWQRRSAIGTLKEQIKTDTASLDAVLGVLGREVRVRKINSRVLESENRAIDQAEERKRTADREFSELQNRQAEENSRFAEIESDRDEKVNDAETALEEAKLELGSLEAQRRGLREKRKAIDRQLTGLIKNAEARETDAGKLEMGEPRQELRRAAEALRRDAAALDPERQDIDRRLAALDRPISKETAKVEALKAELESARRSLNDAREGHRHRLSEIDAERAHKSRELAKADAEIQRRLVTLGTLVNLNRIKHPDLAELYARIDVLRSAIGSRTTDIDRLSAERESYDKRALTRGALALGGAFLVLCLILAILIW